MTPERIVELREYTSTHKHPDDPLSECLDEIERLQTESAKWKALAVNSQNEALRAWRAEADAKKAIVELRAATLPATCEADVTDDDRELLQKQGWKREGDMWMPPTSYRLFTAERAVRIARHKDFAFILAVM